MKQVAIAIDGMFYTPPVDCGLLPGTYRQWLIDKGQIKERVISIEEALQSQDVYLMNSIRGMQKVQIIISKEHEPKYRQVQVTLPKIADL